MKRIIIITGASSGLGREFAFQIPKERAADEIWLLARRKDKLESLALELAARGGASERGATGPKARVVEIDLGGRNGIAAFSAILEKEHRANVDGGIVIDTLVNNAGFGTYGTFIATGLDRQLDMIDLNVLTLTGLCHSALPYMTKGSLIVNVASLAAFIPLGNFAVYAATKAYVLSFSTALAAEVEDEGIFVSDGLPRARRYRIREHRLQRSARKSRRRKKSRRRRRPLSSPDQAKAALGDHGPQMEIQGVHEPLRRALFFRPARLPSRQTALEIKR